MTKHLLTLELDRIIAAVKEKTVLEHDYSVETVEFKRPRRRRTGFGRSRRGGDFTAADASLSSLFRKRYFVYS